MFWLVRVFCREEYQDEVLGDLEEIFLWRVKSKGLVFAWARLLLDTFSSIRLFKIRNKTAIALNFLTMISLKVTLRTFWRHKATTFINLLGLACGFMVFMSVFQYVHFESNYEEFNPFAEDLYRINNELFRGEELLWQRAESVAALGSTAAEDLPGVLDYVKFYDITARNNCVISLFDEPEQSFKEDKIMFASASMPRLFALNMLEGDTKALSTPDKVIISETAARKYFGNEPAMGQQIVFDDDDRNHELLTVSGVFEDYPENSHLKFDVLISFETLHQRNRNGRVYGLRRFAQDWTGRHDFLTYLRLSPQADHKRIVQSMQQMANEPIKEYRHFGYSFDLQKITDIHTGERIRGDVKPNTSPVKLNILRLVAIFVLLLALVNFVNLTTATALSRARETGVRKVLGSTRKQLIWQFLFESLLTGVFAFLLGLLIYYLVYPSVNIFLPVSSRWFWFEDVNRVLMLIGIVCIGSLVAGIYPAFVLSGFRPTTVLKGAFKYTGKGGTVRKALVVFQTGITVFLLTGLMVVVSQVSYMLNNDTGMETEQVIVVPKPGNLQVIKDNRIIAEDLFRNALEGLAGVNSFATSNVLPGSFVRWKTDLSFTAGHEEEVSTRGIFAQNYLKTLGIDLLAGRDFLEHTLDTGAAILNKSAALALGFEKPGKALGVALYVDGRKRTVVGVMEDYHHESFREDIGPMVLRTKQRGFDYFFLKLDNKNLSAHLEAVEGAFLKTFPGNPFHFFFLEDHFNQNYKQDEQFSRSFSFFAIVAALIAGIGLYSLSSFISLMRRKEIGIRKALGASFSVLMLGLNAGFLRLVLLALVIAGPLSIWAVEFWLNNFPYRISLDSGLFLFPALIVLLFSVIVVSIKTASASLINPVHLLRNE